MKQKKRTCANRSQGERLGSERRKDILSSGESRSKGPKNCKIEFYADGVATVAPHVGNPKGKGAPPRSKIGGWSMSSRRRMREFMLTHELPENYRGFNCTFTIPGPPLPPDKIKQLKNTWAVYFRRAGVVAIWRAEVQERGSLHYHMLAGLPLMDIEGMPEDLRGEYTDLKGSQLLKTLWLKSLSSLGSIEWFCVNQYVEGQTIPETPEGCSRVEVKDSVTDRPMVFDVTLNKPESMLGVSRWQSHNPTDLSKWVGAEKYAADVQAFSTLHGAWKRYMNDHTSKAKQAQIGENIGRHWGVIGKKAFNDLSPVSVARLTHQEYSRYLRWSNRLKTPYIRCEGALFGKRKGFKPSRGKTGRCVTFCFPETYNRMLALILSDRPKPPEKKKPMSEAYYRAVYGDKDHQIDFNID